MPTAPMELGAQSRGFTLLEMLAAIAIFTLLSLSARQLLLTVMNSSDASIVQLQRLQDVEYAMLMMEQDFRQLVDRGVRVDGKVTEQSLFAGEDMLETDDQGIAFVRANWRNPGQQLPRSELQKVYYRLKKSRLERMYDYVLDAPENTEPVVRPLLEGVNGLRFRFFYNDGWQDRTGDQTTLPQGVAVVLSLDDLGELERRFRLPGSWTKAG